MTEQDNRLVATLATGDQEGYKTVNVTDQGHPVGAVTFGPTVMTVVLERSYMNWSRQVVRLARATAGV